jgi:hypothetical protein
MGGKLGPDGIEQLALDDRLMLASWTSPRYTTSPR